MPGTTRSFTYTVRPAATDLAQVEKQARYWLGWVCDGDTRVTCHDISGLAFGVVTLSLTVRARDRWWATQIAQDLLNKVLWGIKQETKLELSSERLEPHTNRGYRHGRVKTYRESSGAAGGVSGTVGSDSRAANTSSEASDSTDPLEV